MSTYLLYYPLPFQKQKLADDKNLLYFSVKTILRKAFNFQVFNVTNLKKVSLEYINDNISL